MSMGMRRLNIRIRAAVAAFMAVAMAGTVGCDDNSAIDPNRAIDPNSEEPLPIADQQRIHNAWRVDIIISDNSDSQMLAEYNYDAEGRLTQADLSHQYKQDDVGTRYEDKFVWQHGRLTRQLHHMWYKWISYEPPRELSAEKVYAYDDNGNLLHTEGEDQYAYDDDGRLVQTYSYEFEGMVFRDRLEWDERGNVIRHICTSPESNMVEEPIPGSLREWVYEYEYDNNPKPNFGLGDSFFWDGRYNPWPLAGNADEQLARTLSRNNLIRCEQSGYAYRYTYNDQGLPKTVQTIWIGIDTAEPMVQTIIYKPLSTN